MKRNKKHKPKLRKEYMAVPVKFLELLGYDLDKIRLSPGRFAFNFFYSSKKYYKLIECNRFKEIDNYFYIDIIVEKLQNFKSYYNEKN